MKQYIVICQNDDGNYVQSTRRRFFTREEAEKRMGPTAVSRRPVVAEVPAVALNERGYPLKDEDGTLVSMYVGEPHEPTLILTEEGEQTMRRFK